MIDESNKKKRDHGIMRHVKLTRCLVAYCYFPVNQNFLNGFLFSIKRQFVTFHFQNKNNSAHDLLLVGHLMRHSKVKDFSIPDLQLKQWQCNI